MRGGEIGALPRRMCGGIRWPLDGRDQGDSSSVLEPFKGTTRSGRSTTQHLPRQLPRGGSVRGDGPIMEQWIISPAGRPWRITLAAGA